MLEPPTKQPGNLEPRHPCAVQRGRDLRGEMSTQVADVLTFHEGAKGVPVVLVTRLPYQPHDNRPAVPARARRASKRDQRRPVARLPGDVVAGRFPARPVLPCKPVNLRRRVWLPARPWPGHLSPTRRGQARRRWGAGGAADVRSGPRCRFESRNTNAVLGSKTAPAVKRTAHTRSPSSARTRKPWLWPRLIAARTQGSFSGTGCSCVAG